MKKSKSPTRRRGPGPQQASRYFSTDKSRLSKLQQQSIAISAIKATLWPAIPTSLQTHCDVANFRGHTLVLMANSPVWAARLRHMSPQILHAARLLCKIDAQKLQIKIQPLTVCKPRITRPRTLPQTAATHLREVAAALEDEELKEILLTIANRNQSM